MKPAKDRETSDAEAAASRKMNDGSVVRSRFPPVIRSVASPAPSSLFDLLSSLSQGSEAEMIE